LFLLSLVIGLNATGIAPGSLKVVEIRMKIIHSIVFILLAGAITSPAQTTILPLDGFKLFTQYCAVCHGTRAAGHVLWRLS